MSKLDPSHPFSGVGLGSIILRGSISHPMMLGTLENDRTESIVFDIAEVNVPFNAILGRIALYQFMDIAHHGYQILKMPLANGIIKIPGDCSASGTDSGAKGYCWLWHVGPSTVELAPALLIICTLCAAVRQ
jgi:hypothetical protein